jgi:hypothetical protein
MEYNHSVSLSKAANFLGVDEIVNFDYKSLNSIRKLSKTFGCTENELIRNLCPITNAGTVAEIE